MPAAMAAEEARAQGGDAKFWEMADRLFAAPSLDDAAIEQAAKDVGLDVAKVKDAIATQKHRARVERDQRLVMGLGARGTPAFFVNGRKLSGAQPFETFRALVDEELRKAEALVKSGTPADRVYAKLQERGATAPVMTGGAPGQAGAPAAPPPAPPAVYKKVSVRADDPARGPKEAKLSVVLFSDFQCPFCARVEPTLKQLEEAFPGQVRVVWKHQPIASLHPNALGASLAAEAAREQGKFWELHEVLFQHQRELDAANLPAYAKEAGLDVAKFGKALAAKKGQDRIAADQQLAGEVGASGTPTLFFNCRQVVGAQPFERMKVVAEEELAKADKLLAGGKPDAGFYDKACAANVAAAPAAAQGAQGAQPSVVPAALTAADVPVRADDPVRGNPKAPVTVVLFSDFQCPYCARVGPTLEQLQREYGEKVRIVWKHQPLPMHASAIPAAEAAEAAREQGKFWPMHDRLFAAQRELSPETYRRIAKEVGLDLARFDASTASGRAKARIQEDQAVAARVGAGGTPTMFVNGERVVGAVPYEQLKAVVDRKLAAR
jgi:protein-disulfide isomerase